ncbi:hypothetical protein NC651_008091 [Populus alba x Populus x berolinensis]|nr:hypothetical protein NC651_008091 [Populus alba x Populus x berolinensis]
MVIVIATVGGESCVGRASSVAVNGDDAARAGVIEFVTRGGCYDVEELVPAVGGMWSVIMVGRFVVTLDG